MYYQHFGLSGPPFQFTPTADALYLSREHREALAFLEWSVMHEPSGLAVLVGESGVGKTTLVCSVIARYRSSIETALVTNPRLSFEQMIALVLAQLGVAAGGSTKFEMLQRFLHVLDERAADSSVAIILDEAQELSDEVFGEFRLLSNQGMAAAHNLRIVFVGQPELLERLSSPQLHALNQRIGARAMLHPMQTGEVHKYVDCQLEAKGARSAKVFVSAALSHLIGHSQGNPRRVNVLCHNAMLAAYGARRKRVDLASARNAVADYDNLSFRPRQKHGAKKPGTARWRRPLVLALTAAALGAFALAYVQKGYSPAGLLSSGPPVAASASVMRSAAKFVSLAPEALVQPMETTPALGERPAAVTRPAGSGRDADRYGGYRPAPNHGNSVAVNPNRLGAAGATDRGVNGRTKHRDIDRIYSGETPRNPAPQNTTNDQAIP